MATLTWGDVTIIGGLACIGFALVSYWVSSAMARRNISGQLKAKPPKRKDAAPAANAATATNATQAANASAAGGPASPARKA